MENDPVVLCQNTAPTSLAVPQNGELHVSSFKFLIDPKTSSNHRVAPNRPKMSSTKTPLYKYTDLNYPLGKPIRLLTLEPGSFSDHVVVTISHLDLETTEYEGLSYTWGEVPPEHEMIYIRRRSCESQADLVDTDDVQ